MAETAAQKKKRLATEAKASETGAETTAENVEVTVTEAVLEAFPEMIGNGIVVGDIVEMSPQEAKQFVVEKEEKPAPVVAKGAMAVLKDGREYIRTYGADQKDELNEFLSKSASYTAVPDASITTVEVMYEVKEKDGTIKRPSQRFTDKAAAIRFRNEHRSNCIVVPGK